MSDTSITGENRQRCARCGAMFDPGSEHDVIVHGPDLPRPAGTGPGAPPKLHFASKCHARREVCRRLSDAGADPEQVLKRAASALWEKDDLDARLQRIQDLESLEQHVDSARWIANRLQGRTDFSVEAHNAIQFLDSNRFAAICEYLARELRWARDDVPEVAEPLLGKDDKRIVFERLRAHTPALVALGPRILALWSIAEGLERPIRVHGLPNPFLYLHGHGEGLEEPLPRDGKREELFQPPPFATKRELEQFAIEDAERRGGDLTDKTAREILERDTADRQFDRRVDRWENLINTPVSKARAAR